MQLKVTSHSLGILFFTLMLALSGSAQGADLFPSIKKLIPHAEKVGESSFSILVLDVYDIALYASNGKWQKDKPYALSVRYHVEIEAKDIIERSIDEMRRQNPDPVKLGVWAEKLRAFFPKVERGTVLAALHIPGRRTVFYKNGSQIGVIDDPQFGPVYMGIWLDENTSEPSLRAELLGIS